MGFRSFLSKPLAKYVVKKQNKWSLQMPVETQHRTLKKLVQKASSTAFGKDHQFEAITSYDTFKKHVPIRDYEGLKPYVDRIIAGERDILWPGVPLYFAKTSGTTSGAKFIPISKDSIKHHINAARDALLNYIYETGNSSFLDKNLIFLSGSPVLDKTGNILTGRLSGIVNHHVPSYLRSNQLPDYKTNCIEDWEEKLEKIIEQTLSKPMSLISGIPPWVQMYFDKIIEKTGKGIQEVFPHFSLFVHGGVNFRPYADKLYDSIGRKIDTIETYPASEGFIAFQDSQHDDGLLMCLNSDMFFEFIPTEEYFNENPTRLSIEDVELGKNYALIIHSNAGLWGYSIGDTIKFVSKDPYKIVVTGRIKHFISAFGEHVIAEEIEKSLIHALEQYSEAKVAELTVAPQVNPQEGLPYHEWFIAFEKRPSDLNKFSEVLDQKLQELNPYYKDLIQGKILKRLVITPLASNAFESYMKSIGKLGGQNKVPRLSNDRVIANKLYEWRL